jgi:Tol biopolymer transport system component
MAPSPTPPRTTVPSFLDLRTGTVTPLAEGLQMGRFYDVSPDGTMIAYSACCGSGPDPVWVANIDGTGVREITPEGVDGVWPQWSLDGSMLAYEEKDAATEGELGNVVVVDVGTGKGTQVTEYSQKDYEERYWFLLPRFTPDGRAILFDLPRERSQPKGSDVWTVPVEGGEPTLVLRDAVDGAFSPDGRSLLYVDLSSGEQSGPLVVAGADGSNPRVLVEEGAGVPRWSPDGTRISYLEGDEVHVIDAETGDDSLVGRGEWPGWYDNDTLIIVPAT